MSTPDEQSEMGHLSREALIEKFVEATYELSTTTVFFHAAVAEQVGLGPTEEKTILILSGFGPLTAGEIGQHTGLTSASVTSLIDRLESKGFVRRVRDPEDRRKVIVALDQAKLAELMAVFASLQGVFEHMIDDLTDEQLAFLIDYSHRSVKHTRAAIAQLAKRASDSTH